MQKQPKQSKKTEDPSGIRLGVWLIVASAALMCMLAISLPSRYGNRLSPDTASESLLHQEASTQETRSRIADRMEFAPATYQSETRHDFDEAVLALVEQMTQDRSTWWDSPHNLP